MPMSEASAEAFLRQKAYVFIGSMYPPSDLPPQTSTQIELVISPEAVALTAHHEGDVNISVRQKSFDLIGPFPLSHSDSVQLGMGYMAVIYYDVEVTQRATL